MTPTFSHRAPVPLITKDYGKFRPYLREDFLQCCAYCLLHERFAGGEESFEIDHFKPKSMPEFAHLIYEYTNLYYSCHRCNKEKRAKWPTWELQQQGYYFVDVCIDNFSMHYEDHNGEWLAISNAGKYTVERLRLNSEHLVEIRKLLASILREKGLPKIDWNVPLLLQLKRYLMSEKDQIST